MMSNQTDLHNYISSLDQFQYGLPRTMQMVHDQNVKKESKRRENNNQIGNKLFVLFFIIC